MSKFYFANITVLISAEAWNDPMVGYLVQVLYKLDNDQEPVEVKSPFYWRGQVKEPGLEIKTTQSELDMSYHQRYQDIVIPEAYERLLLDT